MKLEVCIDSVEGAVLARKFGAQRVELYSALSVGGMTPSLGLVSQCVALDGSEVHAMLRCREGGFHCSKQDQTILLEDLEQLANCGVSGVVFGCLTADYQIDIELNTALFEAAKKQGLEVTFHRAFDFVTDPKEALTQLIQMGFDRVLTSGKKPKVIEGIDTIRSLVQWSDGAIDIMAGGGVNASNAQQLAMVGVDALHFTSHKLNTESLNLGMGSKTMPDERKIAAISALFE